MEREGVRRLERAFGFEDFARALAFTDRVGDVSSAEVEGMIFAITPVPGGAGPMTRAMLLCNALQAARVGA